MLDADTLAVRLERFGGSIEERRAVARAARDLADAGHYERDTSHSLTADLVVGELADAREGSPADRWNWWVGSLVVAYGDAYAAFEVRRWGQ